MASTGKEGEEKGKDVGGDREGKECRRGQRKEGMGGKGREGRVWERGEGREGVGERGGLRREGCMEVRR